MNLDFNVHISPLKPIYYYQQTTVTSQKTGPEIEFFTKLDSFKQKKLFYNSFYIKRSRLVPTILNTGQMAAILL
jgi:hypothetical protein